MLENRWSGEAEWLRGEQGGAAERKSPEKEEREEDGRRGTFNRATFVLEDKGKPSAPPPLAALLNAGWRQETDENKAWL